MSTFTYGLLVILILTTATLAAHGWSFFDGLYLDDHLHRLRLADHHWSPAALLDAATIKPDEFIDSWWQEKPILWQYLRPFAILVAKTVYQLSGGSVKAWHAISIVLHLANAFMVHRLCLWTTRRRSWAVVGALLFIVYSHNVFAVAWLAAQNIVLQTFLTLAALLCYIKASGLDVYGKSRPEHPGRCLPTAHDRSPAPPPLHRRFLAATVILWCLGLLSRENAIVLPVFCVAFDLCFGGWGHVRARLPGYTAMALLGIAFLYGRMALYYHPMPDFYVRRLDGNPLEYGLWLLAKLLHFCTAAVWLSPMTIGPSGRYNPFTEVPGDCALMLAILGILGSGYYLACRRSRGWWIWPLWILLSLLPVVQVVATPYVGYMPSIGFAVGMILGPALQRETPSGRVRRWSKGVAIWFLIATTIYMPIYRPMWYSHLAAERSTIQYVLNDPPPKTATDLFFLNLPFTNIYAHLHLQHAWGMDGLHRGAAADYLGTVGPSFGPDLLDQGPSGPFQCHALTYCPDLLRMDRPCRLEQLDPHTFTLAIEQRAYFSGALGRFLIEGMTNHGRFQRGQTFKTDHFEVAIAQADEQGVWQLKFRFHQPLASDRFAFYLGTTECAAARVRFWGPGGPPPTAPLNVKVTSPADIEVAIPQIEAGQTQAADLVFAGLVSDNREIRTAARHAIATVVEPIARRQGCPVIVAPPDRFRAWWHENVNEETLLARTRDSEHFAALRWSRDRLFRIRQIASHIIRSDLYLTGPPFPGPR
ncbi:MAG TPA: hypothetical protein PKY77_09205 [Phycisphaerae bacterium]|nr:hypothetical protein [Phycisphaerae bacterium]HRY68362.1 hypothetical protein [Phycisphaerae bacterium]HSA28305.1 hypothetical protein [Phycisphaerae bacterium]